MLFLEAMIVGFGFTLGLELALGLCLAFKAVSKGASEN